MSTWKSLPSTAPGRNRYGKLWPALAYVMVLRFGSRIDAKQVMTNLRLALSKMARFMTSSRRVTVSLSPSVARTTSQAALAAAVIIADGTPWPVTSPMTTSTRPSGMSCTVHQSPPHCDAGRK